MTEAALRRASGTATQDLLIEIRIPAQIDRIKLILGELERTEALGARDDALGERDRAIQARDRAQEGQGEAEKQLAAEIQLREAAERNRDNAVERQQAAEAVDDVIEDAAVGGPGETTVQAQSIHVPSAVPARRERASTR